ncbi:hypothetical protein GOP47_0007958 [Adiantum capillus-veneris]|uniref:Enhancer of mRNA-decapping protein 4 WD40 repeat region domain-containing protein n=1 Tax=Adiantum capillus-veneris TaxID=13818 RepID=A0A9D4V1M4_ADICA|nr:hypothetical protein GOP47_0007467 [Adiantum capillus-veneris]KAI5078134.1 hypothetical protein GOP47_0007958 [Adiantum capillus-veneris]
MGTTGSPERSDVQNLFKNLSQPGNVNLAPLSYGNSSHPFHNFPASSFPQTESYPQSTSAIPGSYSLMAHGSTLQQHPSFSNDQVLAAPHQIHSNQLPPPPPLSVPTSTSFHTKSSSRPSSPSVDSERLKVLLSYQSTGGLDVPVTLEPPLSTAQMSSLEASLPSTAFAPAVPSAPPVSLAPALYGRLVNNKLARGRYLKGEHVVYDVDVRLPGDVPPQLEVTPITMYMSQSVLLNGRQIAVNRNYICYGLRPNRHIRILNISTASRSLLRGHSERVTDMAFFSEDVHLLASASSDGRVFVRKIVEGPDDDNKLQITDQILLALHFFGDWDSIHPRISWLCHTQDVLVVGMSKYVFIVDIPTVRQLAAPDGFDVEEPVHCSVHNLMEGIRCINEHDGDVTDLATSQWGLSASASNDGMIRLWKDRNASLLTPHQGQDVGAVALLSAPLCPDHIVLLSAGSLCRELKLWVPATRDGWFPQSGQFNWKCIQTLELTSSAGGKTEDSFFNQVVVVPKANLILLANAKKSALYVVHVSFGTSPAATRLDYLTEFSVMWPILSFTATSENAQDGDGFVQVYCVQTQAIQQYSLDLTQCLPPAEQHAVENDLVYSTCVTSGLNTDRLVLYEGSSNTLDVNQNMKAKSSQATSGTSSSVGSIAVEGTDTGGVSDNVSFPMSQSFSINTVSVADSRVIGISATDTKEVSTRDVPVHVSKISAPASQVEGPVWSPRGSPLAKARARSPADDRPIFHVASTIENVDYLASYEQPDHSGERTIPPSIALSPNHAMWDPLTSSPRRHFNDTGKMNEDKEWQPSVNTPVLLESQSNTSSTMHLITPSELMSMVARSKIEDEGGPTGSSSHGLGVLKELIKPMPSSEQYMRKSDIEALTIETKEMNETAHFLSDEMGSKKVVLLRRGAPGLDSRINRTSNASLLDSVNEPGLVESAHFTQDYEPVTTEEAQREDDHDASEEREPSQMAKGDDNSEQLQEVSAKVENASAFSVASQTRRKKNKNKTDTNVLMNLTPPLSALVSSVASTSEQDMSKGSSSVLPSKLVGQINAMQESVNQLVAMQRDFQKQIQVILAVPVAKEVKRVEAVLGQRIEKVLKAHMEAMWARLQEDFAKREKADRDQMQQLSSYLSNYLNKDLPVALERALKKEFSTLGPSVARLVTPGVEKSITVSVNEAFQKGISEKGISQLEKSVGAKIEASLSRQLQSQFQTTGRSALQDALRSSLEGSVIPAFERSCQSMFAQVDAAFQKGFADNQTQAQQQLAISAIASSLQEAVTSATSLAASLNGELADGQRRLLALVENLSVSRGPYVVNGGLPDKVMTVQHVEESLDPTKELARLLSEQKIEEAFNKSLSLADVGIVSWLCNQVDLETLLTSTPLPLSQGVLLALVQQLGCDLGNDTSKKLTWIKDAALALNPHDPGLPPHVMRHFLEKLYNNLHALLTTSLSADLILSTRLVIHVVNSLLTACK